MRFIAGIVLVAGFKPLWLCLVLVGGAVGVVVTQYGTFEPPAPKVQQVNLSGLKDSTKLRLLEVNPNCQLSGADSMVCHDKENL